MTRAELVAKYERRNGYRSCTRGTAVCGNGGVG